MSILANPQISPDALTALKLALFSSRALAFLTGSSRCSKGCEPNRFAASLLMTGGWSRHRLPPPTLDRRAETFSNERKHMQRIRVCQAKNGKVNDIYARIYKRVIAKPENR
jgi:hypothetical protein